MPKFNPDLERICNLESDLIQLKTALRDMLEYMPKLIEIAEANGEETLGTGAYVAMDKAWRQLGIPSTGVPVWFNDKLIQSKA